LYSKRISRHAGKTDITTAAQAAQALQPIAGKFAFLLFSLGIIGTGLLAVPVLAGSAAVAVGESRGWKVGLEYKPWEATGFYSTIGLPTLISVAIDWSPLDPNQGAVPECGHQRCRRRPDHCRDDGCHLEAFGDGQVHRLGPPSIFRLGGNGGDGNSGGRDIRGRVRSGRGNNRPSKCSYASIVRRKRSPLFR